MSGYSEIRQPLRKAWLNIVIFSIAINIFLLVPSIYMMQVYDRVLPAASVPTLIYLSLIAMASLVFLGTMDVARSVYCQRAALSLDRRFGGLAFLASMGSPKAPLGDTSALRDLNSVRNFIASRGLANLVDLPFAPLFMALLFFVHPILCLVTVCGAFLMLLFVAANHFGARRASAKAQEVSVLSGLLAQAFTRNADTVHGMGMTRSIVENWGGRYAESAMLQDKVSLINAIFSGASRTLRMGLQLAILCAGAVLVMAGEMTAGMIFASSIISGRALQPIDQLVGGWKQIIEARKAWHRLDIELRAVQAAAATRLQLPKPLGKLSVRDLVWSPPHSADRAPVLKRLSFDIMPGEVVALLGPSGAGKSTLARILAGVLCPTSGAVSMDEADYKTWNPEQLGREIGYLAQDVQLLPGTIAQNIARFEVEASDTSITSAASRAEAHALIATQRHGYQTMIGAGGSVLSGGTSQRIGLARALFGEPKILVLDEPNANLDAEGDAALEKVLLRAKASGTTIIIVTHRQSIVLRCDKALVLREGAIEIFAPAAEVLQHLSNKISRSKPSQASPRNRSAITEPKSSGEHLALVHDVEE